MRLTATEAALLGLLLEGERSGYDLRKRIERSVAYFWAPAKSQIYAVLPRLEAAGLATRREIAQSDRPDKHVYRITAAGRRALKEWIERGPVEPAPDKNPMLLKLFFGGAANPDALIEQVRERRAEGERLKRDLEEIDSTKEHPEEGDDFFPSLTRLYGHMYAETLIAWAEEVERRIATRTRRRARASR